MMNSDRIQTDPLDNMPIDSWVEEMYSRDRVDMIDERMREMLLDEAHAFDVDVYLDDGETVVVDTLSFTGSHTASVDRNGEWQVDETGWYIHDETEWEMEIGCPVDPYELEEEVRKFHSGEPYGSAALTVGERNPHMGSGL